MSQPILVRDAGAVGPTAVAGACLTGWLLGGVFVAWHPPAANAATPDIWVYSLLWFVVGATLGFLQGAILGVLAQDDSDRGVSIGHAIGVSALYALPALALTLALAGWVSLWPQLAERTTWLARAAQLVALAGSLVVLGLSGRIGVRSLVAAMSRWPERNLGTALVLFALALGLAEWTTGTFVLWSNRIPVAGPRGLVLVLAGVAWGIGPTVTMALRLRAKRAPWLSLGLGPGRPLTRGLGVLGALLAALTCALVAAPFHASPYRVPLPETELVWGAVRLLTETLVDGVLLRLLLITALVAVLGRSGPARMFAVLVAAAVETAFHLPGIQSIGLPASTPVAYTLLTVSLPALLFGLLYVWRGWLVSVVAQVATAGLLWTLVVGR